MKTVVDTKWIKAWDDGAQYIVHLFTAAGDVVEHEPFPRDPKGLTCLMDLATTMVSGKVYLKRVLSGKPWVPSEAQHKIEAPKPRKGILK